MLHFIQGKYSMFVLVAQFDRSILEKTKYFCSYYNFRFSFGLFFTKIILIQT